MTNAAESGWVQNPAARALRAYLVVILFPFPPTKTSVPQPSPPAFFNIKFADTSKTFSTSAISDTKEANLRKLLAAASALASIMAHQQYNPDTRVHKIISYTRPKEVLVQVVSAWITLSTFILFLNTSTLDFWTVHSSPSTAWAVTPLLIYPLLPSRGLFSIPCEVFLIWPTAFGILYHFGSMILDSINEQLPSHPWQFWQAPLMWLTLLAGCDMLSSKRRGRESEKEKNFKTSSDEATYWLLHVPVLTWVIVPYFRNLADEADWLWFGVRLLLLLAYVRAYIGVAHILNKRIIRPGVWRFASRRISSWTWLPQNGAERDFQAVGGKVLAGSVLAMPFVLTVIMAIRSSV